VAERPRVYRAEGVVLRRRNVGEADTIFTVLGSDSATFEAVARGVRKARSHMRGHLEPLTRSRLLLARGRSLDVFTQAETVQTYRAVREDLERSATAIYCAELVERSTVEHAEHPGLYELFLGLLDALEAGEPLHVARYFELHLLSLLGYDLQIDACAACGARLPEAETLFAAAPGGLVCAACRPAAGAGRLLSVRAIKALRYARATDIPSFAALRVDEALGAELQAVLAEALRYHLDHEPRSRRYVEEVAHLGRAISG
jgi:DNA repair protein RecO (recombination protein O)